MTEVLVIFKIYFRFC